LAKFAGFDPDPTNQLLSQVCRKYSLLETDEESTLIKRAQDGDLRAYHHLINANLRLVVSVAKRYLRSGVPLPDLINMGSEGLEKAIEKFDESKGCRFSTYAVNWIKQKISRGICKEARIVRLPTHVVAIVMKIRRESDRLEGQLGRQASVEELAAATLLVPTEIEKYIDLFEPLSLEQLRENNGDISYEDFIPETALNPADAVEKKMIAESIRHYLPKLSEIERFVIDNRFGIDCEEGTLEEIGRKLKVTRERVRQIEQRAIKKLKLFTRGDPLLV